MIDYLKIQQHSFLKFKTNDGNDNDLYIVIRNNPFREELTVKWHYPMQDQQNSRTLKYQELNQYNIEVFSPNQVTQCPDCFGKGWFINTYLPIKQQNLTSNNCRSCYGNGYLIL